MNILFLGSGESTDTAFSNTSAVVYANNYSMLIDIGFDTPSQLFASPVDLTELDALYLTHFHADHTFGFPIFAGVLSKLNRKKPLSIIGQPGLKTYLNQLMELGYPGMMANLPYEIIWHETIEPLVLAGLSLSFAKTGHSLSNYAICIDDGTHRLGFSGDGTLTEDSKALLADSHLLVHEAFQFGEQFKTHETIENVFAFADSCPQLEQLAIVHLGKQTRAERSFEILDIGRNKNYHLSLPEPGDSLTM